ncbi:MAG: phosphatidate cytidylyltransferase [Kordiimonadaceae bacterium]|nr:phosphatidate cytidylyltransferase [Kordiimonadaceae bacterium]
MAPVAGYIILSGGLAFLILIGVLTILILYEWNGICEKKPLSLLFFVQVFCSLLLMFQISENSPYIDYSIISSLISIAAVSFLIKAKVRWALLGFLYAIIPTLCFLIIQQNYGGVVLLWMMLVIWAMDTGGYFAGKNIGGPKMSPKISPNKTWSGLAGGTILAMIAGSAYGAFMQGSNVPLFNDATILLILSGLFAILSQLGDLAESAVKRKFAVKDSGAIIPGHGGIMDRVDGVLFVAPAVVIVINVLYG